MPSHKIVLVTLGSIAIAMVLSIGIPERQPLPASSDELLVISSSSGIESAQFFESKPPMLLCTNIDASHTGLLAVNGEQRLIAPLDSKEISLSVGRTNIRSTSRNIVCSEKGEIRNFPLTLPKANGSFFLLPRDPPSKRMQLAIIRNDSQSSISGKFKVFDSYGKSVPKADLKIKNLKSGQKISLPIHPKAASLHWNNPKAVPDVVIQRDLTAHTTFVRSVPLIKDSGLVPYKKGSLTLTNVERKPKQVQLKLARKGQKQETLVYSIPARATKTILLPGEGSFVLTSKKKTTLALLNDEFGTLPIENASPANVFVLQLPRIQNSSRRLLLTNSTELAASAEIQWYGTDRSRNKMNGATPITLAGFESTSIPIPDTEGHALIQSGSAVNASVILDISNSGAKLLRFRVPALELGVELSSPFTPAPGTVPPPIATTSAPVSPTLVAPPTQRTPTPRFTVTSIPTTPIWPTVIPTKTATISIPIPINPTIVALVGEVSLPYSPPLHERIVPIVVSLQYQNGATAYAPEQNFTCTVSRMDGSAAPKTQVRVGYQSVCIVRQWGDENLGRQLVAKLVHTPTGLSTLVQLPPSTGITRFDYGPDTTDLPARNPTPRPDDGFCTPARKAGPFAGGGATNVDPVLICTAEQFLNLRTRLGSATLMTNLDFSGYSNIEPLPFLGDIDGNGYQIANFRSVWPEREKVGIFEGAFSVRNLIVNRATIAGKNYVGAVAALLGHASDIYVINSDVQGVRAGGIAAIQTGGTHLGSRLATINTRVRAERWGGGIFADAGTEGIENSYSNASITVQTSPEFVGGIAGIGGGTYRNLLFEGSILTGTNVKPASGIGGIIGTTTDVGPFDCSLIVRSHVQNASIVSDGLNVGGIVGTIGDTALSNSNRYRPCGVFGSSFSGSISGSTMGVGATYVGGIVGTLLGGMLTDSTVSGTIRGQNRVGGLIGSSPGMSRILANHSTANLTAISGPVGGAIGIYNPHISDTEFAPNILSGNTWKSSGAPGSFDVAPSTDLPGIDAVN